jgi:pimeloyl-ACP methyl ester carboxylesterase
VRSLPRLVSAFAVLILIGCGSPSTRSPAQPPADAATTLGAGFVSSTAPVNGTTLHYVRGGSGPAIVLLHGYPEDWYAFHRIMPRLATASTVVAVDLRGVGGSAPTADGYDAATMAEDIRQLTQHLKLDQVYVVGHDIGGMVAYAFARLYPRAIRGVMIVDIPLPGLAPSDDILSRLWHVGFHQMSSLPEQLIAGRQAIYFRQAFFDTGTVNKRAVSDADIARYAESYAGPEKLRAGFEFYRAFPMNAAFNVAQRGAIDVPLVLVGGDSADTAFGSHFPDLAETLRHFGWSTVKTELVKNSGHYVMDDQPEALAELIERYGSQ